MASRSRPRETSPEGPGRAERASETRLRRVIRSPFFFPSLVFAAALVLRLIYVSQVRHTPFFETLGLDALYYDRWARGLAAGEGYRDAFFMSPLYPYFLAGLYRLFGRDLFLVRVVQILIGSASATLVYLLAMDLFDKRVAVLAAFTTACYGALIFYDGSIVMTPLLVFLNVLALFLLVRADRMKRPYLFGASGAALALAAVGRAAAVLFVPLAVLWILLEGRGLVGRSKRTRGQRPGDSRREEGPSAIEVGLHVPARVRWRLAAVFVAGILVVIAPVTLRNYVVSGDFVPITSNGGLNFYIGNGELATGGYAEPEGLDRVRDPGGQAVAEAELGRELTPSEVSSYWSARAWSHIASDPAGWLKLLMRKLSFALSSYEFPQLENYDFQRGYSALLSLPFPGFGVVAPLGLLGVALALRRRRSRILGFFLLAYIASIVTFFVLARYRLPAVPVLAIGAAYALVEGYDSLRRGSLGRVLWFALVVATLAFLVNANLYSVDRLSAYGQIHYRLGIIYGDRGDIPRAAAEYQRAIELDPNYPKSYLNLGALQAAVGRYEEAAGTFEKALEIDPDYAEARINLAMVHMAERRYEDAIEELEVVLSDDPANAQALTQLGVALYKTGREDEALEVLNRAETADVAGSELAEVGFYRSLIEGSVGGALPREVERALAVADSLVQVGKAVEAARTLREAASMAPGSGIPLQRLAVLERNMGLLEEAISHMREAIRIDPTVPHGHFTLGVFLNESEQHYAAIQEYEAELRINPDYAPAHRNLAASYLYHLANRNRASHHYSEYKRLGGEPVPPLEEALGGVAVP